MRLRRQMTTWSRSFRISGKIIVPWLHVIKLSSGVIIGFWVIVQQLAGRDSVEVYSERRLWPADKITQLHGSIRLVWIIHR